MNGTLSLMTPFDRHLVAQALRAAAAHLEGSPTPGKDLEAVLTKEVKAHLSRTGEQSNDNFYKAFLSAHQGIGINVHAQYLKEMSTAQEIVALVKRLAQEHGWIVSEAHAVEWKPGSHKAVIRVVPGEGSEAAAERLFHITDQEAVPSILRTGLHPSKAREWLPERVYLFPSIDSLKVGLVLNERRHEMGGRAEKLTKTPNVAVLEIDGTKIPNLKLRDDPEWSGDAVYTSSPIPPSAISVTTVRTSNDVNRLRS